jgi:hypothetical protein
MWGNKSGANQNKALLLTHPGVDLTSEMDLNLNSYHLSARSLE